jgi:hypothetical protein
MIAGRGEKSLNQMKIIGYRNWKEIERGTLLIKLSFGDWDGIS